MSTTLTNRLSPLFIAIGYFGLAVIMTWPLTPQIASALPGFVHGDGYENAHHIWWFAHALQTGQPLFYQPLLGYPNGIEGITLWAHPLQFFPAWLLAFVLPLPAAVNTAILLMLTLNGAAMYALGRYLLPTASRIAPFIAGAAFMLFPTMQGHLAAGHSGLMVQFGVPLFALALLRLRDAGGWRRIGLAALAVWLTAVGHTLQLIYVALPIAAAIVLLVSYRREWAALRRIMAAGVIGGIICGLFLLPVIRETLSTSAYADEGGAVRYSADLLAIAAPSFRHPLYGALLDYPRRSLGVNLEEGAAYFGLVVGGLALIAVIRRRAARWWAWLGLGAYGLALGPLLKIFDQPVPIAADGYTSYVALPFALVTELPFFSLARTPGRFAYTLALAAAVLAGFGAAIVLARLKPRLLRAAIGLVIVGAITFDYQTFWPLPTHDAAIPTPIRDLAARDDIRAVLDLPWDNLVAAKAGLYLQTGHEHALIAGQVTRQTPVSPALLTTLQTTLDPALLRQVGADIVIVHLGLGADELADRARAQLGEPIHADERYIVFQVPPTDAAPTAIAPSFPAAPITAAANAYGYAAHDGLLSVTVTLTGATEPARPVDLLFDGLIIQRVAVGRDPVTVTLPLPVQTGQFYTLTARLDPPCPINDHPALVCRSVRAAIVAAEVIGYSGGSIPTFAAPLTRAAVPLTVPLDGDLAVDLAWLFDTPMTDNEIRYVHVIAADGTLAAQRDQTLGSRAAGTGWAERVLIPLAGLPAGAYTVRVGWYRYPEIAPLFGGPADIGQFVIDAP